MKEEPIYAEQYLEDWRLKSDWRDYLRPAYARLAEDPRDVSAWQKVAMVLGDSGAAPLCLIVAQYGCVIAKSADEAKRIGAHLALCLLDFGLGSYGEKGVRADEQALAAWFKRQLAPFEGDLEKGAFFSLGLLQARSGLSEEPKLEPKATKAERIDAYCAWRSPRRE